MREQISTIIPAKVRRYIYLVLGSLIALEAIWDLVEDGVEGRILASLTALGFGLAWTQTSDATDVE